MLFAYFIKYISFLVFPFLGFLIYKLLLHKNKSFKNYLFYTILFLGSFLFIYSRFFEPNFLIVKNVQIKMGFEAKFILVSDLHLGVFKDEKYLQKVVEKINLEENIDFILIPGDFTLVYDENADLEKLFYPLSKIKFPIFATLGNHDSMKPGPNISEKLIKTLKNNNVNFLHNEEFYFSEKNIYLLGLGDIWANEDKIELIDEFSEENNLIVLAHNPDTTLKYSNNLADLTVSGHTHGGQIRIPFIWKKVIPTNGDFSAGFYENNGNKVYVTSGVGEVKLPMRFRIPPEIVVVNLTK